MIEYDDSACEGCGGIQFIRFEDLDFEGRIAAERLATKIRDVRITKNEPVCTRCFRVRVSTETRA